MHEIKMMPVPGNKPSIIGSIDVKLNEWVEKEQLLITIETAKGKRSIKSEVAGIVAAIKVEIGDNVTAGQVLMEIQTETAEMAEPIAEDHQLVEEKQFDLVILGAGPGGYVAAIYAAMNGLKVGLVEKADLGGTCLHVGCIPTKTLIESANLYQKLRELDKFGLSAENVTFDFTKIMERKKEVIATLTGGIEYLMKKHKIEVIAGMAECQRDGSVLVKGEKTWRLRSKDLILAVGAKQARVNISGIDLDCVLTSDMALSLEALPKSITIIGAGVIGMEFAFIFNSFGVEVQVIEFMDSILSTIDREATDLLQKIAESRGIKFHLSAKVEMIQKTENNMAVVTYQKAGQKLCIASEKVLLAIGRIPNTDGLGLENTEVKTEKGAIVVDSFMQTSAAHIYAIGDVTNIMQLAHVASHQAITAVQRILGQTQPMSYQAVPAVIFTHPEIATVGVTQVDAGQHESSRFDFSGNGKALVMGENTGFVKLIKDKSQGRMVGAVIIGPDAATMINTVTLAIDQGLSEKELCQMIFPHPTTAEAVHEAAMDLGLGALHQ
ncbi:dihydrolipoyl dehydrogenase [Clostridiales bacterium COT073_COT-073]|nr:dihydrolipoyl dehydrogenase [Clostridiales bacterium COT073_COT-073]